jgi:ribosome maturation factor RimP
LVGIETNVARSALPGTRNPARGGRRTALQRPGGRTAGHRAAAPAAGVRSAGGPGGGACEEVVARTVAGLGYELVDVERAPQGLLRVFIDLVAAPAGADAGVTVEDCERVTRQLQYVLEVEGCDYARLEVSSPGLDRPLRREADYTRFCGSVVELTLRQPLQGRRRWRGTLHPREGGWRLEFDDGGGPLALDFALDEVREARLVPVLDFKGRRRRAATGVSAGVVPAGGEDGEPRQ